MMPLIFARPGDRIAIKKVGGSSDTRRFLNNLGFVEGGKITVITENGGNLIVNVKEARVAVSREMAGRIIVAGPAEQEGTGK